ncbi:MAG: patatin-like protein [Coleofasciculaceae cyanobacterium]
MSNYNLQKPEFRREKRLGLVVYGGVSLAIYMNGVCREFYNAVRGRGIYKLVKALTDADIIVDIVSGTSAGGINGVLLSYALANSSAEQIVDFKEFAPIWREDANIRDLMHEPSSEKSQFQSILDGEDYYQNKLAKAFKTAQDNKTKAPLGEWLSKYNELDLFVTGTDTLGRVYQIFDQTGSLIEIKDHRTLFHLKHRQGRKEPFNPNTEAQNLDGADPDRTPEQTYQALGKLCRITSCFPVAFPVVEIGLQEDADQIDQYLEAWGQLSNRELPKKRPKNGYKLHFVDGGVLDNKPFTYTLKEIYYRTANRPVDRKLFYLDANPESVAGSSRFNEMAKPSILAVIQDSLIGLPSYESISNDLQTLKEHNEKISRYKCLLADIEVSVQSECGVSDKVNINESIYLRSRLISLRDNLLPLILRMEQGETKHSGITKQTLLEKAAKLLTESITKESAEKNQQLILQEAGEQIRNLDVEYALRKHFYLVEKLSQIIEQESDFAEYTKQRILLGRINRQIKLLETIKTFLVALISAPLVSQSFYSLLEQESQNNTPEFLNYLRSELYDRLLRLCRFALDSRGFQDFAPQESQKLTLEEVKADFWLKLPLAVDKLASKPDQDNPEIVDWLAQKQISSILEQLKQKICHINDNPAILEEIWSDQKFKNNSHQNDSAEFSTILRKLEIASGNLIKTSKVRDWEKIFARFQCFRELDQVLYPFEYLTDIKEKDLIEIIRFSPNDAKLGLAQGKNAEDKLSGDTLRAFGGFFKKSWRSNDLMWGRLDGLNRLVEALVNRDSLTTCFPKFIQRQTEQERCSQEEYLERLVQEALPEAEAENREAIIKYLLQFAQMKQQVSDEDINKFMDLLVLEGHREILNSELQNVIEDEVAEQFSWNRQRVKGTDAGTGEIVLSQAEGEEKPKYQPVPGYFEKTVSILAAGVLAKQAIGSLSRLEKEDLFRSNYGVGKETILKDIPTIVLTSLATRFALVFRNLILSSLDEKRASRVRGSLTYQFFNKSLQLFYWWLQFSGPLAVESPNFSRKRRVVLIIQIILLPVAFLAIAITILNSLFWTGVALGSVALFWLLGIFLSKEDQEVEKIDKS